MDVTDLENKGNGFTNSFRIKVEGKAPLKKIPILKTLPIIMYQTSLRNK